MKKTTISFMKLVLLSALILFQSDFSFSQVPGVVRCYSDEMDSVRKSEHPAMETDAEFETWINDVIETAKHSKIVGGVYQIPVVFHVIHSGEAVGTGTNVSQAAIQSQIDVLNEDFRRIFGSNGYNTNPLGADTKIEFCLAQRRPDGSAFAAGQPGVNRILYSTISGTAPPFSTGFIDATIKTWTYNGGVATATRGWVPTKYMNIWLCNISGGILGYAQFPTSPIGGMSNCASGGSDATDGVVFLYNSIGKSSVTGFGGVYNEGRTATHEIGHWLGLRHIWGDGGCTVDDYCNDTPEAAAANYGCPTINSCTNAPDPGNDMVANYMDYTDDLCMNIFTNDQKQRMRAVLEGSPNRVSLINSDACTPPNPSDASITDIFNPKGDNCTGSIIPSVQLRNRGSNTLTSATISYSIDNGTVTTFSWTGSLASAASATVALPAFTATLGTHTIQSWSTLPNGIADPSTTYDTSSISFVVSNGIMPNYTQNFEAETFPPDLRWVVENVNGDCRQWTASSGVSASGAFINNAAMLPCFNNGSTSNENLYTPIFILPCNATAASLTFNVAYRQRTGTTNDRLIVEISQDCGVTWTATGYDKQGSVLAVSGTLTGGTEYYPTAANHWRAETINLLSYVTGTSKNIRFRFRGIAANGNNVFVDDIAYTATTPGEIQLNQATTDVLDGGYYNFPNTSSGGSTTQTFTITNTGTSNLTLTGPITVTGTGFSLGTTFGTTTVAAGGTTTFTVTFAPAAGGNFTGNVTFGTNDCDEGTYNFQINGIATVTPPVAEFSGTPTVICQGGTVTFTNLSTNATSYSWNFGAGATPPTSTLANPTVTFSTAGTNTITLTATNAFGNDVETKTAYITVISSTATALPLTEGFTVATFPPTGWSIVNGNSSATTWVRSGTIGVAPTAGNSMMFDNFNFNDADDDVVRVKPLTFAGFTAAQLTFDVAYAPYNAANFDGLEVLVSTDCGGTFTSVYSKSNTVLATAAATTTIFTPTAAQWRNETVDLTAYAGQTNVIVAFKNLSGYGQRLFVDNVNITGSVTATANFTAVPNPVCVGQTVTFTNTSTGESSYNWNFGAGATPATATTVGPHTVTYSSAGTKNVSLQINGTGPTSNQTVTVNPLNTIAAGVNRTTCINSAITTITLATTGATGATFSGLPAGVTGSWAGNVVTISGTPTASGTFNYTVTTTGGCPSTTATGTITVNPANTIAAGINRTTCISSAITTISLATTGATGATFSGLPAGVTGSWAGNVATISGTPTASGTFNYTVTTTGGCPPATATGTITVNPVNTIAAGINRTTCLNTAITTISLATTGATGATFSGLPAGVTGSWAGNVATISGTPTASGTFNYTVTTTGGCPSATTTGTITVTPSNTIAAGVNRTTCIGSAITTITLATTGATGATFSGLPAGVTGSWAGNVATISGTPTASGTFNYTVTTTGGCPSTTATGTITVNPANTIAAGINRTTCLNTAITTITLATTGATGATFSGLPAGVTGSWAGNVATISGTPTASGTFNYTVTTTGGCPPATTTGTITVSPANTIAAGINRTTCLNTAITTISLATTGATGATFSGLPAGVTGSWAGNVATISGTPTASGTFNYTVTTTGGCPPATTTGTITVTPSNTIAAGINRTTCLSTAITTITLATTGATGATFSGLPAGVTGSWAGNVATISGTPTASGTFNYTVTTTGGCPPATATGTITVNPANTIAAGVNQTACINTAITTINLATTVATGATFSGLPAGVTGSWAGNVATISGTPTASGTFNYTVTTTGGCPPATATGTITVNPANTIAAGVNQTACINSTITAITLATTGATGATFSGLPAGVTGSWAGNVATISGTPTASGTFNYTVTTTGGCPATTATGTITVTPANTATLSSSVGSNAQSVCMSSPIMNITYSTTGATGATFSGLPAGVTGSWASNVATITGTPTASGTFNYTVTLTGGCGTATSTGSITVNSLPATPVITPSGPTTFCSGGSVDLSAPASTTYLWSPGGETTQTVNSNANGTYSVTVSNAAGCTATSAPTTVTVNANPSTPVITPGGPTTFCSGGSVDLSAPASTSYLWSPGGETSQVITATLNGAYSVTVSNASGCTATSAAIPVVVNANPSTPVITPSGPTTFCSGGSVDLSAPASTSYLWSPGGETTQTVNSNTNGTYSVTVSNASGCTATSAPTTVTVNANPSTPVITPGGPTTFCSGGSVDLSAPASTTYLWSPGGETTQILTAIVTGTYAVTVSNASGCTATSVATSVTVNPIPATPTISASGPTTFCDESSVNLTSSSATGNNWSTGSTNNSISVNTSGTITLTVTENGCVSAPDSEVITVNSSPVVTLGAFSTVCDYTPVFTLTGESPAGGTFTGNGVSGGTFNPGLAGLGSSTITYTFVDGNGCDGSATSSILVDECLGIAENGMQISFYPNPSTGLINVISSGNIKSVTVYDKVGRLVYEQTFNSEKNALIDLSFVAAGIYAVQVTTEDQQIIENVVIQK